jgi:hypothetical protein
MGDTMVELYWWPHSITVLMWVLYSSKPVPDVGVLCSKTRELIDSSITQSTFLVADDIMDSSIKGQKSRNRHRRATEVHVGFDPVTGAEVPFSGELAI